MKYIFFGTPRFAKIVLEKLIDADMSPIALVCNPDRPIGRKKIITPPPTKILAIESSPDIEIIQPETLDDNFIKRLAALEPDLFVVAAYSKILPPAVLAIPSLGTLGVHPSLLPKYRGASPIQSAILAGETETGVTIYAIDEKTDHGPILMQEKLARENTALSAGDLPYLTAEEKLAELGAKLLIKTIPKILAGSIKSQPQDESLATYTKKFKTEDGFIDEKEIAAATEGSATKKANEILRKINALNPEPGTWTIRDGRRIKLLEAAVENGKLRLITIQAEGEKPKTATA